MGVGGKLLTRNPTKDFYPEGHRDDGPFLDPIKITVPSNHREAGDSPLSPLIPNSSSSLHYPRIPSLLHCFVASPKDSNISATQDSVPIVQRFSEPHDRVARRGEAPLSQVAVTRREPKHVDPDRVGVEIENIMGTLNRKELDNLERHELQLTILASAFVLVQAAGLAMFMYPLVFLHPVGNKWTLRVAFFGFCALTPLFVGYLLDRQRTVRKLKEQILAELDRNVTLQHQASVDLLQTMPDQNHFWDRLTMEYRRAMTMQKTISLLLVKAKPASASAKVDRLTVAGENDESSEAWSDAAKAMSRKLRPTDSGDGRSKCQAHRPPPAGRTTRRPRQVQSGV